MRLNSRSRLAPTAVIYSNTKISKETSIVIYYPVGSNDAWITKLTALTFLVSEKLHRGRHAVLLHCCVKLSRMNAAAVLWTTTLASSALRVSQWLTISWSYQEPNYAPLVLINAAQEHLDRHWLRCSRASSAGAGHRGKKNEETQPAWLAGKSV